MQSEREIPSASECIRSSKNLSEDIHENTKHILEKQYADTCLTKDDINEIAERILPIKNKADKLTFAVVKASPKSRFYILLARPKIYPMAFYRVVENEDGPIGFKTKASAHNLAKDIDEHGLEACFCKLGQNYGQSL